MFTDLTARFGRDWRSVLRERAFWVALLLLTAVAYYASYYRYSLNLRDEGGTEVLLAQRFLAGERPFIDVVPGYNLLWFYPIMGLFKLTGVNFVALRVYCFALSTITAVTGFFALSRAGARPWVAFLVALMLVLVPGMTFKNYMPLLAVTNSTCLLQFALAPEAKRWRWVIAGGLLLGVTLLIRIDVGIFVSVLWLGAVVLSAALRGRSPVAALWFSARALVVLAALVLLLHWPVYLDAQRRGFSWPFVRQYADWSSSFVAQVRQRLAAPPAPRPARASGEEPSAARAAGPLIVPAGDTLRRKSLTEWLRAETPEERNLTLLLYAPLLSLGILIGWSTLRLFTTWRGQEKESCAAALGALLLLGGALTDFPQYFFFRPDSPHLSEFSPGFWVATAGSLLLLATTAPARSRFHRWAVGLLALLLTVHAGLYLWRMLPDRFTGTIGARRNRTVLFHGENGVNVYVTRHEIGGLRKIQEIVREHTSREDYLIAYPYHPVFNVLTDRRTYERNVYVDNAIAEPGWNTGAIARLERYRPAVVILSDWEINGTPKSRFSVWAAPTRKWIQEHYTPQGSYLNFEIYTRPEVAAAAP